MRSYHNMGRAIDLVSRDRFIHIHLADPLTNPNMYMDHNAFENLYGTNVPTVIIMCGIPTSGKTTWIKKNLNFYNHISRDDIRKHLFGKDYVPSSGLERLVTLMFDRKVSKSIEDERNIVLDNTHCKVAYLNGAIKRFSGTGYKIEIVFFDIPLWKAYLRNYIRKWKTGKWIPLNVIKSMYKNYKKINKNDYVSYKREA